MIESDKRNFQELMIGLGEVYNKEITKPLLRIYFSALERFTVDEVADAVTKHVTSTDEDAKFFPRPTSLISQILGSTKQKETDVKHRAELAWAEIERKIARVGSYGKLKMEDRQALAAVNCIGGWQSLCMKTYDELTWVKKEFLSNYDMLENTPQTSLPESLKGILCDGSQDEKKSLKTIPSGIDELKGIVNKN